MSVDRVLGQPVANLDTPALIVDLDLIEANLARMAAFFAGRPVRLRPHVKTHKTPALARLQIAAGAIGITCQKLGEAEVMAAAGIRDILISNQIVTPAKIARLVRLAREADLIVAVDDPDNADRLSEAAVEAGARPRVVVEVDTGMHRCGVAPGEPALELARRIVRLPGLRFAGLMGYEGHTVQIPDWSERVRETEKALTLLVQTKELIERDGIEVSIVSAGGTGTYQITGRFPGITEVEAGSYLTMDTCYRDVGVDFHCALSILTTVISRPDPRRAIVDAGIKAMSCDEGLPEPQLPGATLQPLAEEHGTLIFARPSPEPRVGDPVTFLPSHGCTTFNLHDDLYGVRQGVVEAVWPIAGRGRFR